jgi:hypothetical protein
MSKPTCAYHYTIGDENTDGNIRVHISISACQQGIKTELMSMSARGGATQEHIARSYECRSLDIKEQSST